VAGAPVSGFAQALSLSFFARLACSSSSMRRSVLAASRSHLHAHVQLHAAGFGSVVAWVRGRLSQAGRQRSGYLQRLSRLLYC